jgi:hypothetical protein
MRPNHPDDLEALADAGRRKQTVTDARESEEVARNQASLNRRRARAEAFSTWSVLRGLSVWVDVSVAALIIAIVFGFVAAITWPALQSQVRLGLGAGAVLVALGPLASLAARRRVRRLLARLPFPVEGLGLALDHPAEPLMAPEDTVGPQSVLVTVELAATAPDRDTLSHALAGLPLDATVKRFAAREVSFELRGGHSVEGHRRWLRRSLPAVLKMLAAVHASHPLRRVTLAGVS